MQKWKITVLLFVISLFLCFKFLPGLQLEAALPSQTLRDGSASWARPLYFFWSAVKELIAVCIFIFIIPN